MPLYGAAPETPPSINIHRFNCRQNSFKIISLALLHVRHLIIDVLPAMDGLLLRQVGEHLHAKSAVQVIRDAFFPWPPHGLCSDAGSDARMGRDVVRHLS